MWIETAAGAEMRPEFPLRWTVKNGWALLLLLLCCEEPHEPGLRPTWFTLHPPPRPALEGEPHPRDLRLTLEDLPHQLLSQGPRRGSRCVAQAGLELLDSSDPSASAFPPVAGTIGVPSFN